MAAEYADDLLGEDVGGNTEEVKIKVEVKDNNNNRFQGKSFPPQRRTFRPPMVGQEFVTLVEKVILPVKEFPRYNFVGKLIGPKGSTMKQLQTFCKARISVLGRGSTRDKNGEEELSKSDDPQYEHLKEPLHVLIQVKATKIEAHRRVACALREINKFMGPGNEEMQQELHAPRDHIEHPIIGTDKRIQAPIIRVGIPPPGAIILSEQPHLGRSPFLRKEERPPPNRDDYAYDLAYKRYPETNDRGTFRRGEKRNAPTNGFPLKRFKEEPYNSAPY